MDQFAELCRRAAQSVRCQPVTLSSGLRALLYDNQGRAGILLDQQAWDAAFVRPAWAEGGVQVLPPPQQVQAAFAELEQYLQLFINPQPYPLQIARTASDRYTGEHEDRFKGKEWEVDGFRLSDEQIDAIKLILSTDSRVIVLTGQAGAGKSAVVRWLVAHDLVTVSATTGRAAINVGGCTVDGLFAFSRDKYQVFNSKLLEDNMKACHNLIVIDEASMIGQQMGDLLLTLLERYNKRCLMVGDWAQASPVKDEWGHRSRLFEGAKFVRLEECHRQSDGPFLDVLNKLRLGIVDADVQAVMQQAVGLCPDEDGWVRMYATNKATDSYNRGRLAKHCQDKEQIPVRLTAKFVDGRSQAAQEKNPRTEQYIKQQLEQSPLCHEDELAIGAQVVLTRNGPDRQWVNGDVGILEDMAVVVPKELTKQLEAEGEIKTATVLVNPEPSRSERKNQQPPVHMTACWLKALTRKQQLMVKEHASRPGAVIALQITLDRVGLPITVPQINVDCEDAQKRVTHFMVGFPVRLGWALTIHKCQGMTLDKAWLDMESVMQMPQASRHGLVYVGVSRVRTLEGLRLGNWNPEAVYCSPDVYHLL